MAFAIDCLVALLLDAKWRAAAAAAKGAESTNDAFGYAFAVYAVIGVSLTAVGSALVVLVEPVAGGSGIPEVKAYLQGVRVPRMLRTSTLLCKTVGVLCSVSGGLVAGKEGPMIHAGAIVAGGLSQGSSKTCNLRTMWLKRFRNDHDKRDFVSAGAAAGVAAAFGAPIGGVLFAMEEAATHWSQSLTWRTFCCALASTFTLNLLQSAVISGGIFGQLGHPGLISFGAFLCANQDNYQLHEFPIFALIGVLCGTHRRLRTQQPPDGPVQNSDVLPRCWQASLARSSTT